MSDDHPQRIEIDDTEYVRASETETTLITSPSGESAYDRYIGQAVFVRGVTYHYTGRLVEVRERELVLEDAAWIANSGRFSEALETGSLKEVEPYPDEVTVNREAVMDISPWDQDLPREVQ